MRQLKYQHVPLGIQIGLIECVECVCNAWADFDILPINIHLKYRSQLNQYTNFIDFSNLLSHISTGLNRNIIEIA